MMDRHNPSWPHTSLYVDSTKVIQRKEDITHVLSMWVSYIHHHSRELDPVPCELMILRSRSQLRMVCGWVLQLSLGWRCLNLSSGWQLSSQPRIQNWPNHLGWSTYPCQLGCERKIFGRSKVDRKEKRKEESELWETEDAQNLTLEKKRGASPSPN